MFRAFHGYVEHFYLTDTFKELHPYYAVDFRNDKDGLINMLFTKENYSSGSF